MNKLLLALLFTATVGVIAQPSFDGRWEAEVPNADGIAVRFILDLAVDEERVVGRLTIGEAEAVPIEGGRLRGEVLAFHRTLEDGTRVQFLARVVDGTLRVGMMAVPAGQTAGTVEKPEVVNFTATRRPRSPGREPPR